MVTIFRPTDRIPVKIGDVTYWLAPLTAGEKQELLAAFRTKGGEQTFDRETYARTAVKMALKKVDGVQNPDESPFSVSLDERGYLTDESLDDVLLLPEYDKLAASVDRLAFKAQDLLSLEGVEIDLKQVQSVKKK